MAIFIPQKTGRRPIGMGREVKDSVREARRFKDSQINGSATISDTATVVFVDFGVEGFPDQEDTDFTVFVVPVDGSGLPHVDSYAIRRVDVATNGFWIRLAVAPGAGTSITFKWRLFRDD